MKTIIFLLAVTLYAEDAKVPEPQITTQQKLDYQRARANLVAAQQQATNAQRVFDDKIAELQKSCGAQPLIADAQGDPACSKPEKK